MKSLIKNIVPFFTIGLASVLGGCYLLTPADPPYEPQTLNTDDVAWDNLDIALVPEYGGPTVECDTIQTFLKKSGKCTPVKFPFGAGIQCSLQYPAKKLTFACIVEENREVAVYSELIWDEQAKIIELDEGKIDCEYVMAGPVVNEEPRYPTDPGYRVCLLKPGALAGNRIKRRIDAEYKAQTEKAALEEGTPKPVFSRKIVPNHTPGLLVGEPGKERPAGLYLDYARNTNAQDVLIADLNGGFSHTPFSIVMDARFLDDAARLQAIKDVVHIFDIYRTQMNVSSMMQEMKNEPK